jgi:hypothetical protein
MKYMLVTENITFFQLAPIIILFLGTEHVSFLSSHLNFQGFIFSLSNIYK